MILPRGDDYQNAVQNPGTAFFDNDLRKCKVEEGPFRLPKPYSGGFTVTYHLLDGRSGWAVRCFTRPVSGLEERYRAIGRFARRTGLSGLVPADLLQPGIQVCGDWYPIIKMLWVDGSTLGDYLEVNISRPTAIEALAEKFRETVRQLEQSGMAHGDLQHGNIIVGRSGIQLVDYDGVWLPEISSLGTDQLGHPNYQHPGRQDATVYGPCMDRFSSIIIYVGLRATAAEPSLWDKYGDPDRILFHQGDFRDPASSPLLAAMECNSSLKAMAEMVRSVCLLGVSKVPSLEDFVRGNIPKEAEVLRQFALPRSAYECIDATDIIRLWRFAGQRVQVIGRIDGYYEGRTAFGKPYAFLNFGKFPHQTLTLVLWSPVVDALGDHGLCPGSFAGKWVSVSGMMSSYHGKGQMVVEGVSQLRLLQGQSEAERLLGGPVLGTTDQKRLVERPLRRSGRSARLAAKLQPTASQGSVTQNYAQTLERLYGGSARSRQVNRPQVAPSTTATKKMARAPRASSPPGVKPQPDRMRGALVSVICAVLATVLAAGLSQWIEPLFLGLAVSAVAISAYSLATRS
ncbi:MAG: hypothetical protein BWY10_01596 [Chloroflexi bacterium ADurb.Bin180]|nr:MAG: hypothetical protein BWY10_01596 [Chloroflexi bacterium ADurb.Bin180]